MNAALHIRSAMQALWRLIYPARALCVCCGSLIGQNQNWICPACSKALENCRFTPEAQPFHELIRSSSHAFFYRSPADTLVQALKYRSVKDIALFMAKEMAAALNPECLRANLIVPVPMHQRRLKQRGFNQAELLAKEISRISGIPMGTHLQRTRNARRQAMLSRYQRITNLSDGFTASAHVRGKYVLLVDDVFTTGSTAESCAKALIEAGARSVCAVTFAYTPKH